MRLHELAKELEADSKRLLAIAKELGLGVKSHSSNMEAGTVGILKAAWAEELEERAEKEAKKAAKAAAEGKPVEATKAKAKKPAAKKPAAKKGNKAPAGGKKAAATKKKVEVKEDVPATLTLNVGSRPAPKVVEEAEAPEADAPEAEVVAETEEVVETAVEEVVAEESTVDEAEPAPAGGEGEADETDDGKKMVITIGGRVALPPDADEKKAAAEAKQRGDDGDKPEGGTAATSGPTRRRGARILGRIDLKPQDLPQRHRPATQPATEYDPLDPTRPARPAARHGGATPGRKPGEGDAHRGKGGKAGKGGSGKGGSVEWTFDPNEDNAALGSVRIGHFGGNRRPPVRRPPMRRNMLGAARRARRTVERPTHGISVRPPIAVRDLSEELGVKTREILMHFPGSFDPRDKNAVLEEEHLLELGEKMKREIEVLPAESEEDRLMADEAKRRDESAGTVVPRAPVVAVMGHVDHGKTSLLDALRETDVAGSEAGGITQRTSAYLVKTPSGASVTFLDTPGHKAFTAMRARGAHLTDVAVLVVAADDGVMEQTQEAIDHANAAEVPIVVAINKIDLPGSNPSQVRQQLASASVMVEDWGGEVGVIECSAVTKAGLPELVERLALETELLELRADPGIAASGVIVDSRKDPKLGIVATVVVTDGTLRPKDALLAGTAVGRVRYMLDDKGNRIKEAGPAVPVEVLGFDQPPESGSEMIVVADINQARTVVRERQQTARDEAAVPAAVDAVTLENLFETIAQQKVTEINVLLKADAHGTLDVLKRTVEELEHPEVRFKVIRAAVGGLTEDDVLLAQASNSLIIGFAVTADINARAAITRTGVDVKYYDVIYEMVDDLESALEGELAPERVETVTGHATIREIFRASKYGNIAGCYVTDGVINKDNRVRLTRDSKVIWTGRLDSLKRFKDDVKEVKENYECGLHLNGYDDIKQEDVVEFFEVTEVKRTLKSTPLIPA